MAQVEGVTENQLKKEGLYIEAMGLALVEDYEDAIILMKKFAAQESTEFAPFYYLAKWSWQSDNLVEGINYINRAENLAPESQEVLELKIHLLKENYQLQEASQVAKRAWALDSSSLELAMRPAHLLLQAASPNEAEEWLRHVFDEIPLKNSAKVELLELHIDILLSLEEYQAAEERAEQLLSISPQYLPFLYQLAKVYRIKKDTSSEIATLKKVSEIHPKAWKANLRLIHLQSNGDVVKYLSDIEWMLKSNDIPIVERVKLLTSELSRYTIVTKNERKALFTSAEILYEQQSGSQQVQSLFIEAGGYHGQWRKVIDLILSVIQEEGNQLELQPILRYMHILLEANRYSAVVEWGDDLLFQFPNNGELLLNLAYANAQTGEKEEATYLLQEASRMIRGNQFLTQKADIIKRMINLDQPGSNDPAWFDQKVSQIKADEISAVNILLCLKHIPKELSLDWLEYFVSKSNGEESTYLLSLTQAWAYYYMDDKIQAQQMINDCWDKGCYTHPMAYQLKYKIASDQGNTEKATSIKTELKQLGVSWNE